MTCRLINPSDDIIFDAKNDRVAILACLLVGNGLYGAENDMDGTTVMGIHLRWRTWYSEEFNGSVPEKDIYDMREDIKWTLLSFRMRDSKERSSMNDICGEAKRLAKWLDEEFVQIYEKMYAA